MIEQLTPTQQKQLKVTADKWIKIGQSTKPANRKQAEKGIHLAYELAGLTAPDNIVWSDSPRAMVLERKKIRDDVGVSLRKVFPIPAQELSIETVSPSLCLEIKQAIDKPVSEAVRQPIWNSVCNAVWTSAKAAVSESCYGQHDADRLAFADFISAVLKQKKETAHIKGVSLIAQNAGWWMPHKEICFISERTSLVKWNGHGALHSSDGPALQYPDGFSIYFWHNIKIPDWFIENPKRLTPQKAVMWKDIEQRRVACEIVGWDVILDKFNATILDQSNARETGTLIEVSLPNGKAKRFLHIIYDTRQASYLPVPSKIKTAREAQSQIWGGDMESFAS